MKKYSPILLMGYNRPAMLKASLEYLVKVDARIYVALDIPRSGDTTNEALSLECQRIVTDFSENLTGTRIAKESQGCFKGVTEAITWGFSLEPELIILEDDIRVSETFLTFATQMLKEYEGSNDVGSIAGTNLVPRAALTESESSIRFSAFTSSWGWATWRDRWDDYILDLETFPDFSHEYPIEFWNLITRRYWDQVFLETINGKYDAWDYRWLYSNWKNSRLTLIPNDNLVLNVGFGKEATHTKDEIIPWWLPTSISQEFSSKNVPGVVERDVIADKWMSENHYRTKAVHQLKREISSRFPKLAVLYRRFLRTDDCSRGSF